MRVALIEDHVAYRESFRLALEQSGGWEVVGEANGARDGIPMVEKLEPDIAVIDFMLPDTNGLSLARELTRRRCRTHVMMLGRIGHPLIVRDALRAGVGGFALKAEPLAEILAGMAKVAAGEHYTSPMLEKEITSALADKVPNLARLSPREREILFLLTEGLSSKEIGKALFLSSKTVDAHRLHINRKLGVRSPAALARYVADQGLVVG